MFILWLAYRWYKNNQTTTDEAGTVLPSTGTSTTTSSSSSSSPVYTNDTIFSLKSPMMQASQVRWMQYEYNRVARHRQTAGLTTWPIISEDGKFGSQTSSAMIRMMGKGANSYKEVKQKADSLIGAIAQYGAGVYTSTWN